MRTERIIVATVSDEGDQVIVWGRSVDADADGAPVGFVFQAKDGRVGATLAARVSGLERGAEVVIGYEPVTDGWNRAVSLYSDGAAPGRS